MGRRSVLLAVAVTIALLGTALIVLYVQGIDKRATEGQEIVNVLVAKDTIQNGEAVTAAQEAGKFDLKEVRRDDLVPGAIDSATGIADLVALGTIHPGEQLLAKKFGQLSDSDTLVIPENKVAISVELSDPARVAGFVNPGSDVAIFVSGDLTRTLPDGTQQSLPTFTKLLLPKIQVVGVGTTTATTSTTTNDTGAETVEVVPRTILTLAVTQNEAERIIFANRNAELTFALVTDDSSVRPQPGVTVQDVVGQQ